MAENQTDNNVSEVVCEEPSGHIIILLYYLMIITILSALLTIILFVFTVIRAKEKVKRRRLLHREMSRDSSLGVESDNHQEATSAETEVGIDDDLSETESPTIFPGMPVIEESSNETATDPEDLYETKPKHYSNEYIQMNQEAINEKRLSASSESSKHNHDVEVLSQRVFSRSRSDDVAKFALSNLMRTREDIRQMKMGGGDRKTPWPDPDMRRRNSTWGGSEQ